MSCHKSQPWISDAAQLVHPKDGHEKIFAMLQAYIDESGIHTNHCELCCVGGYFGSVPIWRHFETRWRKTLDHYGIEEFHAKRFYQRDPEGNRVSPYREWSDTQADKFINRLISIITDHRIFPSGA